MPLRIAKFRLTPTYGQAHFLGGGITYATDLVKRNPNYQLHHTRSQSTNLSGLECRWRDIVSPHGHMVSLIVQGLPQSEGNSYRQTLEAIEKIYGSPRCYHPAAPYCDRPITRALKLSFSPKQLWPETKLRSPATTKGRPAVLRLRRLQYLSRALAENLLGNVFMGCRLTLAGTAWGTYKGDVVVASDYQKIDDCLRMVIAGTPAQTQRLKAYLEQGYRAGQLVYGLQVSDRALMTCLVQQRRDRHIHLIDGADGGYALAAKQLKGRLQARAQTCR